MRLCLLCLALLLCICFFSVSQRAQAQHPESTQSAQDPFGRIQFIHTMVDSGPLDVYIDNTLWLDDFDFQAATPFTPFLNGAHKVDIVAGTDTLNNNPLWTGQLSVLSQERYILVVLGSSYHAQMLLRRNVRETSVTGEAEFFMIHAAPDTGPVDIRLRDPAKGNEVVTLIHNNIPYGTTGIYYPLRPDEYNFEITTADNRRVIDVFHFNLSNYGEKAFVFVTSGTGISSDEGFALIGYDESGAKILPEITTTALEEATEIPEAFALDQNYPNPFNPETQIQYALSQTAPVRLTVVDLLGRTVQTLVDDEQPAGSYTVRWDGRNASGQPVPSGVYLYRLTAADFAATRQMVVLK